MSRFPRLVRREDLDDPTSGVRRCANNACDGVAYAPDRICDACFEAQELLAEARDFARQMDGGCDRG